MSKPTASQSRLPGLQYIFVVCADYVDDRFGAGLPPDALTILDQMWKDRDSTKPQVSSHDLTSRVSRCARTMYCNGHPH